MALARVWEESGQGDQVPSRPAADLQDVPGGRNLEAEQPAEGEQTRRIGLGGVRLPRERELSKRLDDVLALQERLTALGFDTGGSDGVIGAKTRAAIVAYQQSRGLPATGDPSRALLQSLG